MKKGFLLILLALSVLSCLKNGSGYEATRNMVVGFNYSNRQAFMDTYFPGTDTVYVEAELDYIYCEPLMFNLTRTPEGKFAGGFALAIGKDAETGADHVPSRYAVCDKDGGHDGSLCYVIWKDTLSTLMPKQAITPYLAGPLCTCTLSSFFVQNTNAAVQAARYGTGLAGGPFTAEDWLRLTVTATLGENPAGEKTVDLIRGTAALSEWTEVKLTDFGPCDAVRLQVTSSRTDMPLYVCIDDIALTYFEKY